MEDSAIVALYWQRDQQAITASDEKYGRRCAAASRGIFWKTVRTPRSASTIRGIGPGTPCRHQRPVSLRAYLARIVRNLSIDRYRLRRSQKRGGGFETLALEAGGLRASRPQRRSGVGIPGDRGGAGPLAGGPGAGGPVGSSSGATGTGTGWNSWQPGAACTAQQLTGRLYRLRQRLRRVLEQEGVVL